MRLPRTVYALKHKATGKIYVGSSSHVKQRIRGHIFALKRHNHPCKQMQEDYNKYGGGYEWYALDTIEQFEDRCKEYQWMEKLKTNNPDVGYNGNDWHFRCRKEASP